MQKNEWRFAVLPDVQLGRKWICINWWDYVYFWLRRIPTKPPLAVVGKEIAERLRKVVAWLNTQTLKFVTTVGDLTDYATEKQLTEAGRILSESEKEFVDFWGNHDVWPVKLGPDKKAVWEAIKPLHYREFESYFRPWQNSPLFKNLKEQGSWLQNYSFVVNNVKFIAVDNNSRRHAPFGLPGQDGVVRMYKESRDWLESEVLNSREEKIIILSHGPLKKKALKQIHKLEGVKEIVAIAGHRHKRSEWNYKNIRRIVTNALYHEPFVLLVEVSESGIKTEYHQI